MTEPARGPLPDCVRCKHFLVTWNPSAPRACKAFGFQGHEMPSVVVMRETGIPCQLYDAKPSPPRAGT